MQPGERFLGSILMRRGVLSAEALEALFNEPRDQKKTLLDLVVESKAASETDVARALASECRVPFIEHLKIDEIPTEVATRLPITSARSHRLLVTSDHPDRVEVVCADPLDSVGCALMTRSLSRTEMSMV